MRSSLLMIAGLAGLPMNGFGQEVMLEARGGWAADERGAPVAAASAGSMVHWQDATRSLSLGGEARTSAGAGWLADAGAGVRLESSAVGARIGVHAGAAITASDSAPTGMGGELSPRVGYGGRHLSVSAGPFVRMTRTSSSAEALAPSGLWPFEPPAGSHRQVQSYTTRGGIAQAASRVGPFTAAALWRISAAGSARWQDVQGRLVLDAAPLTLAVEAGRRRGAMTEDWVGLAATMRMTRSIALVTRGGRYAADPLSGRAGGRHADVGIRMLITDGPDF